MAVRTDLALELAEGRRVQQRTQTLEGFSLHTVTVTESDTDFGRPPGQYATLSIRDLLRRETDAFPRACRAVAQILCQLAPSNQDPRAPVLVIGLGNRAVTPDAIGPLCCQNVLATRHLVEQSPEQFRAFRPVAVLAPGVLGTTGVEIGELVLGVIDRIHPELILAVDALAARNVKRLGRTIQLTDTGITPGSGIGNHRNAINEQSLGLPVISLGVPTVVNAATIVADAMSELIEAEASSCQDLEKLDEQQRQELAHGLLSPKLNELFVTPKNIDESIKQLSFLLSEGLNIALLGNKEENAGI